jgi:PAS domain S-box-containing protein
VDVGGRANERRFKLLWSAVLALVVGGLVLSGYSEAQLAERNARRAVSDTALVLKQHMNRHFEGASLIMRHAAADVSRHPWEHSNSDALHQILDLEAFAAETEWVDNLWLIDRGHTARYTLRSEGGASPTPAPAVARAAAAAMAAPDRLVLGEPLAGRFVNWPSFIVARAIPATAPDAPPLGAVVIAIAGDSMADVFSPQVLGPRGTIALVGTNGLVLARYPALSSSMSGRPLREGPLRDALRTDTDGSVLTSDALPDGQERILSFARIDNLPLVAAASFAMADVRDRLIATMWPQTLLAGLVVAGLLALYPFMMRRLRFEREAAREVAERELLFRSILNNVGVGVCLVAADGTIRFANTGFDRLLGYDPGSLTGHNLEDLTHPDDRLSTMYRISRMEALGPSGLSYEKRYIRRDGSVVEGLVTLSLKPRVGQQEPLLVGVVQDLTEQRSREKAIAFQNSLLRIQQEASPDALLVTDADGRVRSWNTRFRTMWDVPEALLSCGEVRPVLRHIAAHVAPGIDETYGEADQAGWLRRVLTDGRVIDTLESELRDAAGTTIGHVCFFRDVSARLTAESAVRESEARYRALVEQSPEAIVVYSHDRVLFANSAARALFGYENQEDWPENPTVSGMVSPAVREQVRASIQNNTASPWNGIQEDLQRRDGSLFDAWVISAPIRVQDQPAAQAVIRPLDAGHGVRGRLMQTAKMATLGQMAASVAHELSQPLNILSMGLEGIRLRLARGDLPPEDLDGKLEQATRQCGRMAEIIDHIRVFSRSSKGRSIPFDAAGPLRGAVEMMRPVFERENMVLDAALPARLAVVQGSPLDLEQVVINLLKNAFDALQEARERLTAERGPDWRPRVSIAARLDSAARQLSVEVADSGPGIPAPLFEDIFEPFFTTKCEGVGTGLGLSISMSAITKMGGTLRPANRNGAVFTIRLPISESSEAVRPPPPPAVLLDTVEGGVGTARGPTGHVLVVEPDAATRQALAVVLIEHGFRVTTAGTAPEAEGKARLDPPRVLLCAQTLPGGEDMGNLLRRLQSRDPSLSAIVLATHDGEAARPTRRPGVRTVLPRPVDPARLLPALWDALSADSETAAP